MPELTKQQKSDLAERLWQASADWSPPRAKLWKRHSLLIKEIQEIIALGEYGSNYTKQDLEKLLDKAIDDLKHIRHDLGSFRMN